MTPRLRRFLLYLLGFAAFMAFNILTPLKIWAGIMFFGMVILLLVLLWQIAKDPLPWRLPWRRP